MAILITGGARSGKSRFAEQYAARLAAHGMYVATCQAFDNEMDDRISKHKHDREASGFIWETKEEPLEAAAVLQAYGEGIRAKLLAEPTQKPPVVLLDCLTLWLTNWMFYYENDNHAEQKLAAKARELVLAIQQYPYPLLIVTNEVGDGIVPVNALARAFRDEAGRLNQAVAAVCDKVFLVTAGIPVDVKALAFRWEELT
ncbi:bifunctional adenosylcobinamide kinase/adenosylcobinamide-phosphate guanylyltransferase [Paenibacillus sp. GCM10027627]|uniref:bifunctional adenosylcobinamide kinase/adenosylcobinamide-phosphate guanylyltransferase n=1 Tax=unclassified Paenibacillus TaxID=185978 RepID=UPI00363117DD